MGSGKACLGDLWPDDGGMILVGEDAADGAIRHIDEVTKGLECGCVCMGCGRKLVAKKGEARRQTHHFAHHADGSPDCAASGESLLHIYAKRVIERQRMITLPPVTLTDHRGMPRTACGERVIVLHDISLETRDGEVVPDIVAAQPDGRRLFIEVCNFHRCPPEKIRKLREMDVDVLEIYVSGHRSTLLSELDEAIIHSAPRTMLQCRIADDLQGRLDHERDAEEARRQKRAEHLVAAYRDNRNHSHVTAARIADEFVGYGFAEHLDLDDTLPSAFIVFRRQWQSAILFRLLDVDARNTVRVLDMLRRFSERNWIKRELAWLKSEESRSIVASGAPDFRSPYEEILGYLKRLQEDGVVLETRHGFSARSEWLRKVTSAVDAEKRGEECRVQFDCLFRELAGMMQPVDGDLPTVEAWLGIHAGRIGVSVDQLLRGADGDAEHLLERLRKLVDEIGNPAADAPELLLSELELLPIETLMWRVRAEFYEAAEVTIQSR